MVDNVSDSIKNVLNKYLDNNYNKDSEESESLRKTSLGRYLNSTTQEDADPKEIFRRMSIDVGGGGSTISKDDLSAYIEKAENEEIELGEDTLNLLKDIEENWDDISNESDSISYTNLAASGYKDDLLALASEENTDLEDLMSLNESINDYVNSYISSSALGFSADSSSSLTKSGLNSVLQSLLTGYTDENDDANADLIDALVNLKASYDSSSNIELEA